MIVLNGSDEIVHLALRVANCLSEIVNLLSIDLFIHVKRRPTLTPSFPKILFVHLNPMDLHGEAFEDRRMPSLMSHTAPKWTAEICEWPWISAVLMTVTNSV